MNTVIFACVHNAGRSQMAAAWFNALVDSSLAQTVSAGTQPASYVHPEVVAVMLEIGMDLAQAKPRLLTQAMVDSASDLVTMGCGESCPVAPPAVRRADWPIDDPKGLPLERVRAIRDEIRARVAALIEERSWTRSR